MSQKRRLELALRGAKEPDEDLDDDLKAFVEEAVEQDLEGLKVSSNPMESIQQARSRLQQEYAKRFQLASLREDIAQAVVVLREAAEDYLPPERLEALDASFLSARTTLENSGYDKKGGMDFLSLAGFDESVVKDIEQIGEQLFEQGLYEGAGSVFYFLANFRPSKAAYWFREGLCRHLCEDWDRAIRAYQRVCLLHPDHLPSRLYLSDCLVQNSQIPLAKEELARATELFESTDKYPGLKSLLDGLHKKLEGL